MDNGYLGQIILFAGNFAPQYWMLCAGQTILISQNNALFSILGTQYGGDGQVNFKLPDLRGIAPIGAGQSAISGTVYTQGIGGGSETTTLTQNQLPSHTHLMGGTASVSGNLSATMNVNTSSGGSDSPSGNYLGNDGTTQLYSSSGGGTLNANAISVSASGLTVNTSSLQIQPTGLGQPFSQMQPYLPLNYIICVQGLYPTRA